MIYHVYRNDKFMIEKPTLESAIRYALQYLEEAKRYPHFIVGRITICQGSAIVWESV